jgi:hypothetical protein
MRVVARDHVQIAMPAGRETGARRFYQDVLGVLVVSKPPHLPGRGGCWFEHRALKIHLEIDTDFRPARKAQLALLVEDLPGLKMTIEAADYQANGDETVPVPRA